MNRTGDQTCFLFSCRDRDSVSNFAQAYSEAIRDKETTLSALGINPSKKYCERSWSGLSHRGHRLPAWVHRYIEAGATRHDKRIRQIAITGLTGLKPIAQGERSTTHSRNIAQRPRSGCQTWFRWHGWRECGAFNRLPPFVLALVEFNSELHIGKHSSGSAEH